MPCLESSFFIVAVASPQFTWPDEENVLFMRLCTEVFFEQMALVATLEFRERRLHVDMHDTLLGDIRRLLLATTNILEYVRAGFLCLCEIECTNRVTVDL